jgi:hypothetical protein
MFLKPVQIGLVGCAIVSVVTALPSSTFTLPKFVVQDGVPHTDPSSFARNIIVPFMC